ncbi:MAG: hypothetical protein V3S41_08885 [Spirochaetia bacterium]
MRHVIPILSISLLVTMTVVGFTADEFVVAEVWAELDPIVADGSPRPFPRDVALERLLDEVQYVVSGLVYGYRFVYVPGDPSREIAESFELEPYASIPRGDPRLTVLQTWIDGDLLVARVGYELSAEQSGWYEGWHSSANDRSTGIGVSSLFLGPTNKTGAVSDGIRSAVREHVRALEFNRPREITGAVLLASYPVFGIVRGNYQATVDILLQIDRIDRFQTY